jgi:hypothetical protein
VLTVRRFRSLACHPGQPAAYAMCLTCALPGLQSP